MDNTMQLSRRGLFKLAGAGTLGVIGAGALAGCAPSASTGTNLSETGAEVNQHDYSNYETKEMEAYAVVAGGGAAGLLAAYTLAKAGKKPLILEKRRFLRFFQLRATLGPRGLRNRCAGSLGHYSGHKA